MAVFSYKGFDSKGKEVSGLVEAPSKSSAFSVLKSRGIYPIEIVEESKEKKEGFFFSFSRSLQPSELSLFFRTLSTLLEAGIPIVEAVSSFAEDEENKRLKLFFTKVVNHLKEGNSFSESLRSAGLTDPVILSLVSAGEKSALLPKSLITVSNMIDKKEGIKSKVIQALIYPAVLFLVSIGVVFFMVFTVVPRIKVIYKTANVELPFSTRLVLAVSDFAVNHYFFLLFILALVASCFLAFRKFRKSRYDELLLKLPVIGELLLYSELVKFFLTFGDLTSSGVSLVNSYKAAADTLSNSYLKSFILDKLPSIERGKPLHSSFSDIGFFPKVVIHLIKAGESSGLLSEMSLKISQFLENEINFKIKTLTSLLEPATMLVVGVIIGFIIYALLLPILSISAVKIA